MAEQEQPPGYYPVIETNFRALSPLGAVLRMGGLEPVGVRSKFIKAPRAIENNGAAGIPHTERQLSLAFRGVGTRRHPSVGGGGQRGRAAARVFI